MDCSLTGSIYTTKDVGLLLSFGEDFFFPVAVRSYSRVMVEQPEKLLKYYATKENDRGAGVKRKRDRNRGNTKVNRRPNNGALLQLPPQNYSRLQPITYCI